jgi:hypothetical protein
MEPMTKKYPWGAFILAASFEGDGDDGLAVLLERLADEFLAMPFPKSDVKPIAGMSVAIAGEPLHGRDYAYTRKRLRTVAWENLERVTVHQYGFAGSPGESYGFAWDIGVKMWRGVSEVGVSAKRFIGVDDVVMARAIENWCEALAGYRPLIVATMKSLGQDYKVDEVVGFRVLVRDGEFLGEEPWPLPPRHRVDVVEPVVKKYPAGELLLVAKFAGVGDDGLAGLIGLLADEFIAMPFPKVDPRATGMYAQAARTPISGRDYAYTKELLHATDWEGLARFDVYQYGLPGPRGEGYHRAWNIRVETSRNRRASEVSVLAKRFVGVEDDVLVRAVEGWCEALAAWRPLTMAKMGNYMPDYSGYYDVEKATDIRVLARRGKYLGAKP